MKPKIVVFGIPKKTEGEFKVFLHSGGSGTYLGSEVFMAENDETGRVSGYPSEQIEIGTEATITIMSSGIVFDYHTITYLGGDISYVPLLKKETNTTDDDVEKDWNMDAWRTWNPSETRQEGIKSETKALVAREIVKIPIQDSYYYESRIDYTEKFHKLWIGLNAYATGWSSETADRLKILSLVNSPLSTAFANVINSIVDTESAERYRTFQQATGVNMSSDIVRNEIGRSCSVFDFLNNVKKESASYSSDTKELDGLIFLNSKGSNDVFLDIFKRYHDFMASEEGIVLPFNLADAFGERFAPSSVKRYGQLLFHNPFEDNTNGKLFNLSDFFSSNYAANPYLGQTTRNGQPSQEKQQYEVVNPLFFRYLNLLYEFRCAYFHGSLPITEQNNELARTAYTSLREIYPAIIH